jgi:hypothetical protein
MRPEYVIGMALPNQRRPVPISPEIADFLPQDRDRHVIRPPIIGEPNQTIHETSKGSLFFDQLAVMRERVRPCAVSAGLCLHRLARLAVDGAYE